MKKNMIKQLVPFLAFCMAAASLAAGGNTEGTGKNRMFNFRNFDSITIERGLTASITQGEDWNILVEASDQDLDRLLIECNGKNLKVTFKPSWGMQITGSIKISITLPSLAQLNLSGGSRVYLAFTSRDTKDLTLNLSGGSVLSGAAKIHNLVADLSGGSRCELTGKAENISCKLSGGSRFSGAELDSTNGWFGLSGGSSAEVHASSVLGCEASGGSRLVYHGNPTVKKELSGGSAVEQAK